SLVILVACQRLHRLVSSDTPASRTIPTVTNVKSARRSCGRGTHGGKVDGSGGSRRPPSNTILVPYKGVSPRRVERLKAASSNPSRARCPCNMSQNALNKTKNERERGPFFLGGPSPWCVVSLGSRFFLAFLR